MYKSVVLIFLTVSLSLFANESKYTVNTIPEILLKNADAVVRNYSLKTTLNGIKGYNSEIEFAVTIFNKKAQHLGDFVEMYDKSSNISNYSLIVYDGNGKIIDKSKKKDFLDYCAYDGFSLYTDNRYLVNENHEEDYPYTIEIKYTETNNQTLFVKPFAPLDGYNISIENSSFELLLNNPNQAKIKVANFPETPDSIFSNSEIFYKWNCNNYKAIENEGYMPSYTKHAPIVFVSPYTFQYDGYEGEMSTWNSFGHWTWDLIKNRGQLNQETINEIKTITKKATNNSEKIKIVYDYLQNNSRYVSIQLGIGGFQPFDCNLVDEMNYGDCKALSNYMKSLLKAIDIESNYVIILAGKNAEYYDIDFVSQQMNHVILNVPNNGDTIWLECTNQRIPFGYLGSFTQNRFALEINESGGKLVKTTKYNTKINTQFRSIKATINEDCLLKCNSQTTYSGLQYENVDKYLYLEPDKQKEKLYEQIDMPGLKINSYSFTHGGNFIPYAKLDLDMSINNYGHKSGNRILIPLNILNKQTFVPKKLKDRHYPIKTNWTGYDADTIVYDLPTGYQVEFLPESQEITTPYGNYKTHIIMKDNRVTYIRELTLFKGYFSADQYDDFRNFYKKIAKIDDDKMILIEN